MSRRLEVTTLYPQIDMQDEWGPYDEVDVSRWYDDDVKAFVRKFNKEAKARGDNTRLRSVSTDEEDWI